MAGIDVDCVITGIGQEGELKETLKSLSEVKYFRGKTHLYVVGEPISDFPEVQFIADPSHGKSRTKGRNLGWDAGSSPLVQFLEVGDLLHPDWFQRATKEVLSGVAAICGRIEPLNPDVNRWHRIAHLEAKVDLEEGRLLDVEPLLRREVLEETGGFNESISVGGSLEFNIRLGDKGRRVIYLNFPMSRRRIDLPNWRAYWRQGVHSGYRIGAVASKRKGTPFTKDLAVRGVAAAILFIAALLGLFGSVLFLLLLIPSAIILLRPRIFEVDRIAEQEGFSHQDAALYAWHRSWIVIPQLWGVIRYWIGRLFSRA